MYYMVLADESVDSLKKKNTRKRQKCERNANNNGYCRKYHKKETRITESCRLLASRSHA